ncbi:MAG: mechanosensitive ion channel [Gammaproteobacteria bacterium]|nr:mechanosensitive ion channel [Gammaproteobacteria bacterium]
MKLQLTSSMALATSPDERAQARYHEVKSQRRSVEIAIAEARRATAVLAQRLLQRVAERNTAEPAADRTLLRKQQALLDKQARLATEQRARANQLRSAITIEREASDEPSVNALYERARNELAGVETALEDLSAQLRSGAQLVDMLDARLREREGRMGQSVRLLKDAVRGSVAEAHSLLGTPLFEVNETPVTTLGLLRLGLILTIAWWVSALMRGGLQRLGPSYSAFNAASLYTVGRVLHYLLLTIGIVVGLSSIGVDLTKFALFASALGIGVGFGLQTLISNFVAGLIILFEKSLNVGDLIELQSGVTGMVREINMRATRITTGDNVDILVPNAEFMSSKVMNWTLEDACRRLHVPFTVTYDTDKDEVRKAALAAAHDVEHTLLHNPAREPQVWLVRFGDTGLDFELVIWMNLRAARKPGSVMGDYCWALDTRLREAGIEIPHPASPPPKAAKPAEA